MEVQLEPGTWHYVLYSEAKHMTPPDYVKPLHSFSSLNTNKNIYTLLIKPSIWQMKECRITSSCPKRVSK